MKKYLGLLLLLVSFTSFGQFSNYTNINGRYKWIAGKFDSTFTIPSGTTPSLRVGGGTGPGALFYSTTDSTVYQYTGTRWTRLRGTDTAHVVSAYVRNTTASTMTAGQVVYINGSTGTTPTIALAVNTADSTSAMTFGFVRGTIAPNGFGWITTFGPLEGVNTNAYTEGEVIYLDSIPGQFTHDKPQAPYHMVTLGYIVKKSGGNGTIFAKIQNGYELEELHNVRITSPVRNNGILAYDSVAQLWKDTTLSAIGGVTGSGTSGQVAYWTGTSSQSGSNNLFWDNANNRLGIGTTSPGHSLTVNGDISLSTSQTIRWGSSLGISKTLNQLLIYGGTASGVNGGTLLHYWNGSAFAVGMQLTNNSNLILQAGGTFTDGGQRLQVTGDVLFKGSGNTSGTTALTVQNSDASNVFRVRNDGVLVFGNAVSNQPLLYTGGVGSPSLSSRLLVFGLNNHNDYANNESGFTVLTNVTSTSAGTSNAVRFASSFGPSSGSHNHTFIFSNPTINQTGGANGITRGLYVNPTLTAAADWRSIEWSNNSGWGLYGAGTSANYLAGDTYIGTTTTSATKLTVAGSETAASAIARGGLINTSLTASANNDVLVGLDIAPTFTNGAFTDVSNLAARIQGNTNITRSGGDLTVNFTRVSGSTFTITSKANNTSQSEGINLTRTDNTWLKFVRGTSVEMNMSNTGNLLLGSTVDGGQKLQVTGNVSITGNITQSLGTTSTLGTINFASSNGTIQSTTSLNIITGVSGRLDITKSAAITSTSGTITLLRVGSEAGQFRAFAPTSGTATYTVQDIAAEINQTGGANGITRGLYINPTLTSAADWRSLEWSNNTGFGLYGAGTATNYLGGTLGIGTTSPNASAILELSSTTKGFLPPKMTGTEAEAIASPATGLLVYITNGNGTTITSTGWWGYESAGWVKLN